MSEEPNRFTGPFLRRDFPHFANIQLLLNQNTALWYYNDYWNSVDRDIYKRYYNFRAAQGGHTLPEPRPTPSPDGAGTAADPRRAGAETGPIPPEGANGILLELKGIYYTSLFGGSLKLVFEEVEDYYYEFRLDPFVYDLERLELHVFFVPLAGALHPTGNLRSDGLTQYPYNPASGGIFHDFVKSVKGVYVLKYPNTDLGKTPSPPEPTPGVPTPPSAPPILSMHAITYRKNRDLYIEARNRLNDFLLDWNLVHSSPRTGNAPVSFSYGFLHQLHKESFPTPMIRPRRISIRENDFDLVTEQGEFSFNVACNVSYVNIEEADLKVTLMSHHDWKPAGGTGIHNSLRSVREIEYPRTSTYGHSVFRYNFKDADELLNAVRRDSTETESMFDAMVHIIVHAIPINGGLMGPWPQWGIVDFSIPMVNVSSSVDSVYDLALRSVGGNIGDDTITVRLFNDDNNEPSGYFADIRVIGHLRIK